MSSSSARVAGRSSQPTDQMRTGEFPRMKQMLTATLLSNVESCPATVSQSAWTPGYPLSPESSSMYRSRSSAVLNGACELPSMPMSSVVTPWRTLGSWRGSPSMVRPACECMSMKPGATTWPVASMARAAGIALVSPRRMRIASPSTPTVA